MEHFSNFLHRLHEYQARSMTETGHLPGCPFGNLDLELATQDESIRIKVESILQRIRGYFQGRHAWSEPAPDV